MKRRIFGLLALLLLGMAQTALAFDLSPYRVDADQAYPLSASEIVTVTTDEAVHRVRILRDGEVQREIVLENENDVICPFRLGEGRLMLRANRYAGRGEGSYFRIDYDGSLGPRVPIGGSLWGLCGGGEYLYGTRYVGERREMVIADTRGREIVRRRIARREDRSAGLAACVADSASSFLTAVHYENITGSDQELLLERISASGKVLWQTMLSGNCRYSTICLIGDGEGGAFLLADDADDYKRAWITRLDAAGNVLWSKRLTAKGLVFGYYSGYWDEEADRLVLNAYAVAKSKGIYDVVQLTVSEEGEILSVSAKDFSSRKDYAFAVLATEDGAVFVRSDTRQTNAAGGNLVLVPVADLPDAAPPMFTLE